MKLGVFTVLFSEKSLDDMLDHLAAKGIEAIELGTGGYPGDAHCKVDQLLDNEQKQKDFMEKISKRGLSISALSCHSNPLPPQKHIASEADSVFLKTVKLANQLGVPVVNTFSGCPGDHENAKYPNWPVSPWPNEYQEIVKWQWEEKIIPYWKEKAAFAQKHNVKIGLELHGGFSVHTPATLLRLREACGQAIGQILTQAICGGKELTLLNLLKYLDVKMQSTISMQRIQSLINRTRIEMDSQI